MKRRWFRDDDGTYYRNINLILSEIQASPHWLIWNWPRLWRLHREFDETFRVGLQRKDRLGWRDVEAQPVPFRVAYPNHPILWKLDRPDREGR